MNKIYVFGILNNWEVGDIMWGIVCCELCVIIFYLLIIYGFGDEDFVFGDFIWFGW